MSRKYFIIILFLLVLLVKGDNVSDIGGSAQPGFLAQDCVYSIPNIKIKSNELFTIETWAKIHTPSAWPNGGLCSSASTSGGVISRGVSLPIYKSASWFYAYTAWGDSSASFSITMTSYDTSAGIWKYPFYYAVSVWPDSGIRYLNQNVIKRSAHIKMDSTIALAIGPQEYGTTHVSNNSTSKLDILEVRVYKGRALGRAELLQNQTYNAFPSNMDSLVFWWKAGDPISGNHDTLYDQSGKGNNAVIKGTGNYQAQAVLYKNPIMGKQIIPSYKFQNGMFVVDTTKYRPKNELVVERTYETWYVPTYYYIASGVWGGMQYNSPSGKSYGGSVYSNGGISSTTGSRTLFFMYGDSTRTYRNKGFTITKADGAFSLIHLVYVIKNKDSLIVYRNGVRWQATTNGTYGAFIRDTASAKFELGRVWWNNTSYPCYEIVHLTRLYSKALNATEVATNYVAGYLDTAGMVRESLKFCYLIKKEYMSANYDTFYDLSGNGFNAWRQAGTALDTMAWQGNKVFGVK